MSMIQVRNVSEQTHRRLKARAAMSGRSLSDYLKLELERLAERPDRQELLARLAELPAMNVPEDPVESLRRERLDRE
jgi:antitoxin FitA